ncbi:hypothetical protein [Thermococcus sp.]|uniref:hypothetical protein n=1 Tax=Thermococcus sp. TaxID=35749 RepID=UPI002630F57D|nr:hypothetical protein [Thermococcus sp.]
MGVSLFSSRALFAPLISVSFKNAPVGCLQREKNPRNRRRDIIEAPSETYTSKKCLIFRQRLRRKLLEKASPKACDSSLRLLYKGILNSKLTLED